MNSYCIVEVKTSNKERFYKKCYALDITIYDCIENNNYLEIKINAQDYDKLKKIWFIKYHLKDYAGSFKWQQRFKKYRIFILTLIFGGILLFLLSHIMVEVEVIHSNKEIRDLVLLALKDNGITKNSWRKKYQEIEEIKENILNTYPDKLEWLEIEVKGMKYVVRIEERKINVEEEEKEACHIIATKDGIINSLIYSKGEAMYQMNDYVKAGDILISGIIKSNEEEKNVVCATGSVYAEVWYQVSVSIPLNQEETSETGKVRWNIKLTNDKYNDFVFKSRLDDYVEEKKTLLTLFGTEVSFVKQKEVIKTTKTYTTEEAINYGLTLVEDKINSTLDNDEEIILKKVLKKEENNSTMNIEVFVAVMESIGEQQEFEKGISGNDGDTTTN